VDIEDSSSNPTGSEDLLDPKFLTPRNVIVNDTTSTVNQTTEKEPEYFWRKPQGFGLLSLPNGNIMEYEIPVCSKGKHSPIKRHDSLFSNIGQKDDLNSKASPVKRNGSDFRDKSEMYSSAFKKGGLQCIQEDHDRENSEFSDMMDKPIRTLRDVYMGIRQDIKDRKKHTKVNKTNEPKEYSESSDNETEFTHHYTEDVEMDTSQKQILEDKVYTLITHWNDIDYIKKNHQLFMSPEINKEQEEVKIIPPKKENFAIIDPVKTTSFIAKETKLVKNKKLRPLTKTRKKKMITSDTKFFKNPVMVQEANKAT
jgi:hypothetical protein